jgi:hypothetical protein
MRSRVTIESTLSEGSGAKLLRNQTLLLDSLFALYPCERLLDSIKLVAHVARR